jgi:uncharacterized protein (DUF3820 family)
VNYKEAAAIKMPFGKYAGKTMDETAETDEGLLYLDWLRGERERSPRPDRIQEALSVYLNDPTIASELNNAIGKRLNRMPKT